MWPILISGRLEMLACNIPGTCINLMPLGSLLPRLEPGYEVSFAGLTFLLLQHWSPYFVKAHFIYLILTVYHLHGTGIA